MKSDAQAVPGEQIRQARVRQPPFHHLGAAPVVVKRSASVDRKPYGGGWDLLMFTSLRCRMIVTVLECLPRGEITDNALPLNEGLPSETEEAAQAQDGLTTTLTDFSRVVQISVADELFRIFQNQDLSSGSWVFRGESGAGRRLEPSIERLSRSRESNLSCKEEYVRTEFKRKARHYLREQPDEEDELGWLAVMRHHGAPSRLLDWTRSPYVAAFFAAFEAKRNRPCAIWAINQGKLQQHALNMLRKPKAGQLLRERNPEFEDTDLRSWNGFISSPKNFEATFLNVMPPASLVAPVEPFQTNERMTIQQGLFLCASSLAFTFEKTLFCTLHEAEAGTDWLLRFDIAPDARIGLLGELDRMNITEATLFPGLDGFARSLRTSAEIPGKALAGMARLLYGNHNAQTLAKSRSSRRYSA
jgi:hypothetical protein